MKCVPREIWLFTATTAHTLFKFLMIAGQKTHTHSLSLFPSVSLSLCFSCVSHPLPLFCLRAWQGTPSAELRSQMLRWWDVPAHMCMDTRSHTHVSDRSREHTLLTLHLHSRTSVRRRQIHAHTHIQTGHTHTYRQVHLASRAVNVSAGQAGDQLCLLEAPPGPGMIKNSCARVCTCCWQTERDKEMNLHHQLCWVLL